MGNKLELIEALKGSIITFSKVDVFEMTKYPTKVGYQILRCEKDLKIEAHLLLCWGFMYKVGNGDSITSSRIKGNVRQMASNKHISTNKQRKKVTFYFKSKNEI